MQTNTPTSRPKPVLPMPYIDYDAFDPDAPLFIATSISALTVMGSGLGAAVGFAKNINPFEAGWALGRRWLILSSAFYASREYIVSPMLLTTQATTSHARRLAEMSDKQRGKQPQMAMTVEQVRAERVLDSAIAGGLAFGVYSAFTRGPRVIVKAAFTASLLTASLQYGVNSIRVARLRYLANFPSEATDDTSPSTPSTGEQMLHSMQNPQETLAVPPETTLSGRILNGMTSFLPIKKIENNEYWDLLQKQRASLEKRLREIEKEEARLYDLTLQLERERAGQAA